VPEFYAFAASLRMGASGRILNSLWAIAPRAVTRYNSGISLPREVSVTATAERMRMMRERRRGRGLRELRLVVPDPRLASVRRRVAAQTGRLDLHHEDEALSWIEAVSEFDAPDTSGR
jgi:Protein  of unknown function (DUF3018)